MKVKLLEYGILPKRGREGDGGFDIFLPENVTIEPGETKVINTGVCVEIPRGYAGEFVIRSSIAKLGLIIQPPLIDSNYRGEIHIMCTNPTNIAQHFEAGNRICSLVVLKIYDGEIELVDELSESNRGSAWSGSSGK